jgi:hypothetical protein
VAVAVVVIVAAGIVWWVNRTSDAEHQPRVDHGRTLAQLETLPIKGRSPKTGYSRHAFGPPWTDNVNVAGGHNGCDTRDDILRRDLTDVTMKPGSNGCVVLSGTLDDPYTGTTILLHPGIHPIQIDHVVALGDAWQKGAQQLDLQTRENFANDPRNLQATDGPTNDKRAIATPRHGCRRTKPTAAHTCPGKSRSKPSTVCGSPEQNTTPSQIC